MKFKSLFLLVGITIVLSACTNRQLYDAAQSNRKAECDQMPDVQRAECLEQYQKSYDEYERERQQVLSAPLNCAGDAVNCR